MFLREVFKALINNNFAYNPYLCRSLIYSVLSLMQKLSSPFPHHLHGKVIISALTLDKTVIVKLPSMLNVKTSFAEACGRTNDRQ